MRGKSLCFLHIFQHTKMERGASRAAFPRGAWERSIGSSRKRQVGCQAAFAGKPRSYRGLGSSGSKDRQTGSSPTLDLCISVIKSSGIRRSTRGKQPIVLPQAADRLHPWFYPPLPRSLHHLRDPNHPHRCPLPDSNATICPYRHNNPLNNKHLPTQLQLNLIHAHTSHPRPSKMGINK